MPPWERVVATPDLWDELIDDITGWFDDLRGRWPDVVWWVRRVHEASVSSRMPTTVYIPGANRLIFSRKITLIGPNSESDMEGALRRRFPDLCQDNFGIGQVHLSYYLTEPVADPGWSIRLVIPIGEEDDTPVVLFKATLSTYEGLGAIYVPPVLNKHILITETGLDLVCGPQGELCACYHNGFQLGFAQLEVADLDFISCWLAEDNPLPGASEVRAMACDGTNQPRLGARAWARS